MIEKGRISALQMAIMIYPTIMATAVLLVPAITGKFAKQDMWLSPVWASSIGFLSAYLVHQLNNRYPKQTVIQYSVKILGFIPGKSDRVCFPILLFTCKRDNIKRVRRICRWEFFFKTPMIVVIGSMVLICALAVRGGLEVIARSAQIFVPVVVILLLFIAILLILDLEPKNMFPVMEKGIMPSVMGRLSHQAGSLNSFSSHSYSHL